jgi:hypothetical protein
MDNVNDNEATERDAMETGTRTGHSIVIEAM